MLGMVQKKLYWETLNKIYISLYYKYSSKHTRFEKVLIVAISEEI